MTKTEELLKLADDATQAYRELVAELEEQARLLGMSGEREAKLLAELTATQNTLAQYAEGERKLREELEETKKQWQASGLTRIECAMQLSAAREELEAVKKERDAALNNAIAEELERLLRENPRVTILKNALIERITELRGMK